MTLTSWLKYDHEIKKMICQFYAYFIHILCIFYAYFMHILCIFYYINYIIIVKKYFMRPNKIYNIFVFFPPIILYNWWNKSED